MYASRIHSHKMLFVFRVLTLATDSAKQYAWLDELKVISDRRRSQYHWTSSEINELQKKGFVPGYSAVVVRSTDKYPELADSPNNIRFVKDT